jgi:propionate CoA-transferase
VRNKVVSAADAVALIGSGDMIATSGFVGVGTPDEIYLALERRFLDTGQPRDLGLLFAAAPGDGGDKGLNRLAHDGLIRRAVGGHWSLVPKLSAMATEGRIEAWNLPLGCISQLFREIAGRRPGLLSRVGLGTFVDPRCDGGRLNPISAADQVRLMEIDGKEWLFYQAIPVEVAIIRGTTADPEGNISMEREALVLDNLAIAMAAKASKGFVIAQVERLAASGAVPAKQVVVPGVLVDCVVVAEPANHVQTYATPYSPAFSGQLRVPLDQVPPLRLDERKVIARRCAFELPMGGVVNLGIGMPEAVAAVAREETLLDHVTLTAEPGIIGGLPQGGLDFGVAVNPSAIIAQNQQFDFYDGGGLDLACLGMAQADAAGNVNVSRFGGRFAGAGGFINISQNARALVFAGTFTAGGLDVVVGADGLRVRREGRTRKFIESVEQMTFNGALAAAAGQPVLYVTERCVFRLTSAGLELVEVAPGIDIERDILAHMAFRPLVRDPKPMDARIFRPEPMGLDTLLLGRTLTERFTLDPARGMLFIDFAGYRVRRAEQVEAVREHVARLIGPIGSKVEAVIDYDGCSIDPAVAEAWFDMARDVQTRFYSKASRYTTSAFMRLKLGAALAWREMAPHVFETAAEARATAGPVGADTLAVPRDAE